MLTPMMNFFFLVSAAFFLMIAGAGVYLRASFIWPSILGAYDFGNLVHAHSHVAYFGWSTLALMALMYRMAYGGSDAQGAKRGTPAALVVWHLVPVVVSSAGAFVTFARSGYSGASIFFSALNAVTWYIFIFLSSRGPARREAGSTLEGRYVLAAVAYLFISSLGTWAASAWAATHVGGEFFRELSIVWFVFNFSYGWYTLGILGVLLHTLKGLTGNAGVHGLHRAFQAHLPLLAIFTLPASLNALPPEYRAMVPGWLGYPSIVAGLILGASYLLLARALWASPAREKLPPTAGVLLNAAILFLALKGAAQPFRSLPVFAELMGRRPLVVADLHATLLGFVSTALTALIILGTRTGKHPEPGDGTARLTAALVWCVAGMVFSLYAAGLGLPGRAGYLLAFLFSAPLPLLPAVLLYHVYRVMRLKPVG